jgi:hypothetical protein
MVARAGIVAHDDRCTDRGPPGTPVDYARA